MKCERESVGDSEWQRQRPSSGRERAVPACFAGGLALARCLPPAGRLFLPSTRNSSTLLQQHPLVEAYLSSILVDQTSFHSPGHLRPPPSWWCVRPCAFLSLFLSLSTPSLTSPSPSLPSLPLSALLSPILSFARANCHGVTVRASTISPTQHQRKDTRLRFTHD